MLSKLFQMWGDVSSRMRKQNISSHAASIAFFFFLSIVPMLIMICTIIPYTPLTEEDLVEAVGRLHGGGVHTYAAHLQGKNYYDGFSFREATAFLIGNEGAGLSPQLAEAAEGRVRIPMEGQLESLNAAVAASLLMYEAHRQRFALK